MLDEPARAVLRALAAGAILHSDPAPHLVPPGPPCTWREWLRLLTVGAVERGESGGWQISAAGRALLDGTPPPP